MTPEIDRLVASVVVGGLMGFVFGTLAGLGAWVFWMLGYGR